MPDTEVEPYPQDLASHIAGHEDARDVRFYNVVDAMFAIENEVTGINIDTFASLSRENQQAVIDAANRHARSLCYEPEFPFTPEEEAAIQTLHEALNKKPMFTPEEAAEIRNVMAPFAPVLDWSLSPDDNCYWTHRFTNGACEDCGEEDEE